MPVRMKVKFRTLIVLLLLCFISATPDMFAQRKAVSGAEVTGTFRSYFKGKNRGSYNEKPDSSAWQ